MASPAKIAKQDLETLQGFLHCVSPTLVSKRNSKYFTALLQTSRDDFHKVICFCQEKQTSFAQASKNKTGVKLTNVKRSISYSDPSGFDILCNRSTTLEVVTLSFLPKVPPSSAKLTIAKVQRLGPRQTVGVLTAKILAPGSHNRVVNVNGSDLELQEFQIGDSSGHLKLSLWDQQIVQVEPQKSYKFTNLSTREREGRIYLSGTPSTTIVEIDDLQIPEFSELTDAEKLSEWSGTITGIQILCKHRCAKCQTAQNEFAGKSSVHRCIGCKLMQKCSSYNKTYTGTVSLTKDGTDHTLTITNSAIRSYFSEQDMCHLLQDVQDMEEHFINAGDFSVLLNEDGLISKITRTVEDKPDAADYQDKDTSNAPQ
ncbi:uncharacterized protein [Paramormyrops kingsleyae]|uniref:uncharacterized protein n=1 Tax=Paramormyrops kingsleyae TaxID=1676925 RepID=UPI003B969F8B